MPDSPFLTAEWRYLAMLNYAVDPRILAEYLPAGTELDFHEGKTYVSLVGLRFLRTRLLGMPIPLHTDFDEVNLRFYVRRGEKRATVFIREIVPRWAIAKIAQLAYNEKYIALPMWNRIAMPLVEYGWELRGARNYLRVECAGGEPVDLESGSLGQFIAEHYWGYCAQRDGGTVEYRLEHPPWRVWPGLRSEIRIDVEKLYGAQFVETLAAQPVSSFVAEGSAVKVFKPRRVSS